MRALAAPFGRDPRGMSARWPGSRGDGDALGDIEQSDCWLDPVRCRDCESALADLETALTPADAACVLARLLTARLLRSETTALPGFAPELERDAARSYLRSLPVGDADRRALEPLLKEPGGRLRGKQLASRLDAAAETGARRGAWHSTFLILHAGYDLAMAHQEHRGAARIARRLAAFVSSRGATRASARWKLRAHANERRAELDGTP